MQCVRLTFGIYQVHVPNKSSDTLKVKVSAFGHWIVIVVIRLLFWLLDYHLQGRTLRFFPGNCPPPSPSVYPLSTQGLTPPYCIMK